MKQHWWKFLCATLLFYTVIGGLLMNVPRLPILNESIRNTYFHVPMWFTMISILLLSVVYSIKYLRNPLLQHDEWAISAAQTGIFFGILGILTGMVWAKVTWGAWWVNDPKLNGAAIAMLIYFAYLILRNSFEDEQQRARISAIYNIFAFAMLIPLLFILPRMTDSLHPGNGGNPGFSSYDLDSNMRKVLYPATVGWILLGGWITQISVRIKKLQRHREEVENRQINA